HQLAASAQATSKAPDLVPDLPAEAQGSAVRATCFVVDDEPSIQNIIAGVATEVGYRVERFRSADKALRAVEKIKPGLLFVDMALEGSDAIDVIRGLHAFGFEGVVQLMSGRDVQTTEEVRRVGEHHSLAMLPTLRKPFRPETLRSILQQHLI